MSSRYRLTKLIKLTKFTWDAKIMFGQHQQINLHIMSKPFNLDWCHSKFSTATNNVEKDENNVVVW